MFRTTAGNGNTHPEPILERHIFMADDDTLETEQDDTQTTESTDHSPDAAQVGTSDGDGDSEKSE